MELLGVLGILLLLAIPVVAIAAFVMVVGARDRVRILEARFAALEQRFTQAGPAAAPAAPSPAAPEPTAPPPTPPRQAPAAPPAEEEADAAPSVPP